MVHLVINIRIIVNDPLKINNVFIFKIMLQNDTLITTYFKQCLV